MLLRLDATSPPRNATPQSADSLVDAAKLEMAAGRRSLDERHFGRAEALLRSALPCLTQVQGEVHFDQCEAQRHMHALVAYADMLQHAHDFAGAERALALVLDEAPSDAQALLMRASIRLARGEPRLALSDCSKLVVAVDTVVVVACIAQSIGTSGRLAQGIELLMRTLERAPVHGESTAWALGILADLLERQGRDVEAIATMERSLRADPASVALRIQAVDLLLRHGEANRASALLTSLPATGAVILRRALAAQARGSAEAASLRSQWSALVKTEEQLRLTSHERDRAIGEMRLMNRPQAALDFALVNWRKSRDVEDARTLILAANLAGKPDAAMPALTWMRTFQVEDDVVSAMRRTRE